MALSLFLSVSLAVYCNICYNSIKFALLRAAHVEVGAVLLPPGHRPATVGRRVLGGSVQRSYSIKRRGVL
jgi:hypothetical protein